MGLKDLAEALAGIDTPCQKYNCPRVRHCADNQEACSSFLYFVRTGAIDDPHIHHPIRTSKNLRPEWRSEIVATRALFDLCEEGDDDEEDATAPPTRDQQADDEVAQAIIGREDLDLYFAGEAL